MCGIAGFIDFNKASDMQMLKTMTDALLHRGPDDAGYEMFDMGDSTVGFGHRRLSIIDLSPLGHQPMHFQHLSIVFNGEIYNFKEVRKDLEDIHKCEFKTHSDTEVILQAFNVWGVDCVHRFNGMFAFALLDKESNKLYFFRDRAGVKPLHIYVKDNLILFASELKAFHQHPKFEKKLNHSALGLYFQYGYIPAPHTIFQETEKLMPGTYMSVDLTTGHIERKEYWNVYDYYNKPRLKISKEDALAETDKLLHSAFNYRMVSDVPVGVFLSGGYDSSAVAALLQQNNLQKIKTFTIGFKEDLYNEAVYAKKVANILGTDHAEYYCTENEAKEIIPQLPYFYDEPFGDSSAIPTILVSKIAREQVTVALSADAGDETFAGYSRYTSILNNLRFMRKNGWLFNKATGKIMSNINLDKAFSLAGKSRYSHLFHGVKNVMQSGISAPVLNKYSSQRISSHALTKLLVTPSLLIETAFDSAGQLNGFNDDLNQILAIDYKTYMPDDILTKVDRATMSVSLEGREPLLDYRIIEWAARLPVEMKMQGSIKKYLLKEIVHKYIPKEIMERPKMGFGVPVAKWLRKDLKPLIDQYFDESFLIKQGVFNPAEVKKYIRRFEGGEESYWELIWFMLMFQMWYEQWMVK